MIKKEIRGIAFEITAMSCKEVRDQMTKEISIVDLERVKSVVVGAVPFRDVQDMIGGDTMLFSGDRVVNGTERSLYGFKFLENFIIVTMNPAPKSNEDREKVAQFALEHWDISKKFNFDMYGIRADGVTSICERILNNAVKTEVKIVEVEGNKMHTLVPNMYKRFIKDDKYITGITHTYTVRYRGAMYRFGPWEVRLPITITFDKAVGGMGTDSIQVRPHNFTKSGLFDKGYIMCPSCPMEGRHPHPHVSRYSAKGWSRCCFGNYESLMHEALYAGNFTKIYVLMHEFFSAVARNWWCALDNYYYCSNPALLFDKNCAGCDGKLRKKPISDYKFYETMEDFYPILYGKPQPTKEKPITWEIPKYITKFYEKDFDVDGYDPEGYDDQGFNKRGLDAGGFDRSGYDADGYNKDGLNREGYNREGYNHEGYNREGYNREGFDREGYNRDGLNREGFQRPIVTSEDEFFSEDEFLSDWVTEPIST